MELSLLNNVVIQTAPRFTPKVATLVFAGTGSQQIVYELVVYVNVTDLLKVGCKLSPWISGDYYEQLIRDYDGNRTRTLYV